MKKNLSTVLLVLVFLIGLAVLLYPTISDYVNTKNQSRAIANYDSILESYTPEDYSAQFAIANTYNASLNAAENGFYSPENVVGYDKVLDITGTGIMGYITIDKIDVSLPIYHGTSEGVLAVAAGHLEGSSLPVGGSSTHCVLSAHRGLPSAKLFTNLDKLVVGDIFTIKVLNETFTYQVDQILIVLPDEVEALQVVEGEDYCTLMTCTPYGINTHRLLVRGKRIENEAQAVQIQVTEDATQIDVLVVAPVIAAPILIGLLIFMLIKYRKKN